MKTNAVRNDDDALGLGQVSWALRYGDGRAKAQAIRQAVASRIDIRQIMPDIIVCLYDDDVELRRMTAAFLGLTSYRSPAMLSALQHALADHDPHVVEFACLALGSYGQAARPALPLIARLSHDPRRDVRYAAVSALRELESTSVRVPA